MDQILQGVCWQSAKAKLKNRHFTGGYRGSKPFFLTLQTGSKFAVDKRNIKDVYFSQYQQQEKSAILYRFCIFKGVSKLDLLHSTGHKSLKNGSKSNKLGCLIKFRKF